MSKVRLCECPPEVRAWITTNSGPCVACRRSIRAIQARCGNAGRNGMYCDLSEGHTGLHQAGGMNTYVEWK